MKFLNVLMFASTLTLLTACGAGGGSNGPGLQTVNATAAQAKGLWIMKSEGDELRKTGKLESLCEDVRKEPNATFTNIFLIDESGGTYLYTLDSDKAEHLRLGTINSSGTLVLSDHFKGESGLSTARVSVQSNTMSLTYTSVGRSATIDYLRSSETEAKQYFAAQKACLKK